MPARRSGAVLSAAGGTRRALAPTRTGRKLLRGLGDQPSLGHPELFRIALSGDAAMTDAAQRTAIFQRPVTTLAWTGSGRWRRDGHHSDPRLAAHRARAAGAVGAAIVIDARSDASGIWMRNSKVVRTLDASAEASRRGA